MKGTPGHGCLTADARMAPRCQPDGGIRTPGARCPPAAPGTARPARAAGIPGWRAGTRDRVDARRMLHAGPAARGPYRQAARRTRQPNRRARVVGDLGQHLPEPLNPRSRVGRPQRGLEPPRIEGMPAEGVADPEERLDGVVVPAGQRVDLIKDLVRLHEAGVRLERLHGERLGPWPVLGIERVGRRERRIRRGECRLGVNRPFEVRDAAIQPLAGPLVPEVPALRGVALWPEGHPRGGARHRPGRLHTPYRWCGLRQTPAHRNPVHRPHRLHGVRPGARRIARRGLLARRVPVAAPRFRTGADGRTA